MQVIRATIHESPVLHMYGNHPMALSIRQTQWIDGYVTGFCKISGPNTSMDEHEADFDCNKRAIFCGLDDRTYYS